MAMILHDDGDRDGDDCNDDTHVESVYREITIPLKQKEWNSIYKINVYCFKALIKQNNSDWNVIISDSIK